MTNEAVVAAEVQEVGVGGALEDVGGLDMF